MHLGAPPSASALLLQKTPRNDSRLSALRPAAAVLRLHRLVRSPLQQPLLQLRGGLPCAPEDAQRKLLSDPGLLRE